MEGGVGLDELLDPVVRRAHPVELALQRRPAVVVDPQRCEGGGRRLEQPADLEQLEHRTPAQQRRREARRIAEQLGLEARDVGAVALADVEHPHQRVSARTASRSELRDRPSSRQVRLPGRRVPGPQTPT